MKPLAAQFTKLLVVSILCLSLIPSLASASSITYSYDARAAKAGPFATTNGGHAIAIANIGSLVFQPNGNLIKSDNEWHLTGTIKDPNSNTKFIVDLLYSDIVDYQSAINQGISAGKLELDPTAYAPNGPVDPTTWLFAKNFSGTLTGVAGTLFDGVVLSLSQKGEAPQLGYGANGKNAHNGLSNWFMASVIQNSHGLNLHQLYTGDVNITLKNGVEVPEPASVLMLGLALLALVALPKLRKNTAA